MDKNKIYKRDTIFKIIGSIIILFIIINFIPTSYYIMTPGIAQELSPIITVENGIKADTRGDFLLTAVASQKATIWDYIYISIFKPEGKELDPVQEELPPGVDMEEYIKIMEELMEESKLHAQAVAFKEAGYDYQVNGDGARIVEILEEGSAEGKLKKNDIITGVNGEKVKFATDAVDLIRKYDIGDIIEIEVLRDEETKKFQLETVEIENNPGKSSIGVLITTENLNYEFPKNVSFHTENIVGPSAGTVFALEIYNQLTDEDITKGKRIAGTGSISSEGEVGKIDGVAQKVMAAEKVDADLFLAPEANYEKARKASQNIKVISIKDFSETIDKLKSIE
ncbi:MAG: PDZ domain-containing protein [Bacillota bacterium]